MESNDELKALLKQKDEQLQAAYKKIIEIEEENIFLKKHYEKVIEKRMADLLKEKFGSNKSGVTQFIQVANSDFAQERIQDAVTSHKKSLELIFYFFRNMGKNNELTVSQNTLQEVLEIKTRATLSLVKVLLKYDVIRKVKGPGTGKETTYIVNPDIAWKADSKKRDYCRFKSCAPYME